MGKILLFPVHKLSDSVTIPIPDQNGSLDFEQSTYFGATSTLAAPMSCCPWIRPSMNS